MTNRQRPCWVLAAAARLLIVDLNISHADSFTFSSNLPPVRCFASHRCPSPPSSLHGLELRATAKANEGSIEVNRRGPDGSTSTHRLSYRIVRPMSPSSRQAAPIVALHGGPSIPSAYLYPLEDVVPYRSIVFYDQLGCGRSDEPRDKSSYSIEDSVEDLKALLKHLGVWRFHLYAQSYGGILAFEYMKSLAASSTDDDDNSDGVECLSAILSSAPTNISELEKEFGRLYENLSPPGKSMSDAELDELFRQNHQCRTPEMPTILRDAYENAGTVWSGIDAIGDYVAHPPPEGAARMPSAMILRGEYDFVTEESVKGWKDAFNTPFLRYKTLDGCSHHGLFETGTMYGEIIDSYFGEYD